MSTRSDESDLVLCVYCSASTRPDMSRKEVDTLLEECRGKNQAAGITGMLLFQDGTFFQALEGERKDVAALYEKIERDTRHSRATKLCVEPINDRSFADWSMGFPRISLKELDTVPGLNDFFGRGSSFFDLGPGRAKTLLEAFKEGKWRASLGPGTRR